LIECVQRLRESGIECYAVTNGAQESTKGLYRQAQEASSSLPSGSNFLGDLDNAVLSCDDIQMAKPDPRLVSGQPGTAFQSENSIKYAYVRENIGISSSDIAYFVAAHKWVYLGLFGSLDVARSWDLMPAKKNGFKTVYLDFEVGNVPRTFLALQCT